MMDQQQGFSLHKHSSVSVWGGRIHNKSQTDVLWKAMRVDSTNEQEADSVMFKLHHCEFNIFMTQPKNLSAR